MSDKEQDKMAIVEALLFVSGDPITIKLLADIVEVSVAEMHTILIHLSKEYENKNRGIKLVRIEDTYQLVTKADFCTYLQKIAKSNVRQSVSGAALEVLAIIAYKQPITRVDIDEIRGVKSEGVMGKLLERGLIKEAGKLKTVGRPTLYKTTDEFLRLFMLESIQELPALEEFLTGEDPEGEEFDRLEKENIKNDIS